MRRLMMSVVVALVATHGLAARQGSGSTSLRVLHVQGSVYLIAGAGVNLTVQVGTGGVVVVDTPAPEMVPQVLAEIRKLSPNPIRYIVNTSVSPDYVRGNAALVTPPGAQERGAPFGFVGLGRPSILAHENVLNRLSRTADGQPEVPAAAMPTTTYFLPTMDFYANGEGIILYHQPAAHTDSDSLVHFRGSDVVSTGAVFTPDRYPEIDLERGGSVEGEISALTSILALAIPEAFEEGGTKIVPGVGRICEETDVAEFRDMVVIIRDRIQDMIGKGMTLEQIKAARPSRDYDQEYQASQAEADRLVETFYRSLTRQSGGQS